MKRRHVHARWIFAALLVGAAGCGAGHGAPAGGSAGTGGGGDTDGAAGADGAAPQPDGADAPGDAAAGETLAPSCVEAPTPRRQTGVILSLAVAPTLGGKPFVFGEPNALPSGGTIMALNFRFYVSHVSLLTAGGTPVPVDLVDATGALEPYGVHLFNAEDSASQVLRVRAPAGAYTGVSFLFGLDDACNSGRPADRRAPLNDESQMTWPHTVGYLFLRFEDQSAPAANAGTDGGTDAGADGSADAGAGTDAKPDAAAPAIPPAIHMGGTPGALFAPTVAIAGALSLAAGTPLEKTVRLDVGGLITGAQADVDPASLALVFPTPDVQAGERLRQHVPGLTLFTFAP